MTDSATNTTAGGITLLATTVALVVSALAFIAGYKTHEGVAKASVDDFGKVKLQDHIYAVSLVRAPYEPETVTMAQLKAEAAGRAALEGE